MTAVCISARPRMRMYHAPAWAQHEHQFHMCAMWMHGSRMRQRLIVLLANETYWPGRKIKLALLVIPRCPAHIHFGPMSVSFEHKTMEANVAVCHCRLASAKPSARDICVASARWCEAANMPLLLLWKLFKEPHPHAHEAGLAVLPATCSSSAFAIRPA